MSYILDALRKSDQQRKRGVPLLLAAQAPMGAPKRAPRLLYGTVALVLLGAGVAIGWLRPWQQEELMPAARVVLKPATSANAAPAPPDALPRTAPETRPQERPPLEPAASPAAPAPGEAATIAAAKPPAQQRPAAQKSNTASKQAPAQGVAEVAAAAAPRANTAAAAAPRANTAAAAAPRANTVAAAAPRAKTVAAPAQRADTAAAPAPRSDEGAIVESRAVPQPATAQSTDQSAATGSPPRASAQASAPAKTAVAVNELPVSIQKDLPPLSVMVHAYSDDPAKRMVGINNRLLHEGDEVAPGLKLEQITLDGMILSYKGYSFRRGVR